MTTPTMYSIQRISHDAGWTDHTTLTLIARWAEEAGIEASLLAYLNGIDRSERSVEGPHPGIDPEPGSKRIIARFTPQAWINDYAVDVDPEGETEWDVTAYILTMDREEVLSISDNEYSSDHLKADPNAPRWIRDWHGPFYITVEDQIKEFFDVESR